MITHQVDLYEMCFPVSTDASSMAFIGCIQPTGPMAPVAEMQARWAVQVFKVGYMRLQTLTRIDKRSDVNHYRMLSSYL